MVMIIPNKSYSLMQCRCSCQFFVHSSLYCAVKPCGRKLKEYKNTQPLIGMPKPLPETGVLAYHSSDFMLRVTVEILSPPSIHPSMPHIKHRSPSLGMATSHQFFKNTCDSSTHLLRKIDIGGEKNGGKNHDAISDVDCLSSLRLQR